VRLHESRGTDSAEFPAISAHRRSHEQSGPGHQFSRTRRMSHWQSVLMFSAFGTRSNSVGSITWPAQWHRAVHHHRDRRGKMAQIITSPPATEPSPRGAAPAAPSPNQTICSKHRRRGSSRNRAPECRKRSKSHGRIRRRYRRKGREVGAVRCYDLRTQAPQFSASARQKHEERGRSESFLLIGTGVCPAQRSSQAVKAAERWLGGGAAFGRLQLHGVMVAAHRSLRISRQSRQPPFRLRPARVGGFAA
jgi:hypothetical protein